MGLKWQTISLLGVITLFGAGFLSGLPPDRQGWQRRGQGIYESAVRTLWVEPGEGAVIYAGTDKAVYRSADDGQTYTAVLRPSGETRGINYLYGTDGASPVIYAATDAGLYEGRGDSYDWKRTYYAGDTDARRCLSVYRRGDALYLGTGKGLFTRTGREKNWQRVKGVLSGKPVYHITAEERFLYFGTDRAVVRLDTQTGKFEEVFSLGVSEGPFLKVLTASAAPPAGILLATSRGIYFSRDHGAEWRRLPADNLALNDMTSLVVLQNEAVNEAACRENPAGCLRLMAGTKKGVFSLRQGQWMPVYKGMETNVISHLAEGKRETVYAATDKGIFYLPVEETLPSLSTQSQIDLAGRFVFDHEPGINEVHALAIDYAEVNNRKIRDWRRRAQMRAWLPDLDIGVDSSRDWSSSDSIWGSYSGGGQHYVGPDDKTRGEDIGWDVSLSWDLGDLVWSGDQTSIDSRAKLMVELREDILDEVTRLYFERRRLQMELAAPGADPRGRIDQTMRVAELTALIDALTGGEFSRRIKKNSLTVTEATKKEGMR